MTDRDKILSTLVPGNGVLIIPVPISGVGNYIQMLRSDNQIGVIFDFDDADNLRCIYMTQGVADGA